jgi:hypothetical protein
MTSGDVGFGAAVLGAFGESVHVDTSWTLPFAAIRLDGDRGPVLFSRVVAVRRTVARPRVPSRARVGHTVFGPGVEAGRAV